MIILLFCQLLNICNVFSGLDHLNWIIPSDIQVNTFSVMSHITLPWIIMTRHVLFRRWMDQIHALLLKKDFFCTLYIISIFLTYFLGFFFSFLPFYTFILQTLNHCYVQAIYIYIYLWMLEPQNWSYMGKVTQLRIGLYTCFNFLTLIF